MKIRFIIIIHLFIIVTYSCSPVSTNKPKAVIRDIINSVSQANLASIVAGLSGATPVIVGGSSYTIATRYTNSGTSIVNATQYAYELFTQYGLTTTYQDWSAGGYSGRNVIATIAGSVTPKEAVIICASIDCMPSSGSAPGADDNASGCAGVLEAARILNQYSFDRTIMFVLFTGHEQGLHGSYSYADHIYSQGQFEIAGVLDLQMIGYNSDADATMRVHTRTIADAGYASDKAMADMFVSTVNNYSLGIAPVIDSDGITWGDHRAFWDHEIPAVLIMEDHINDFNPYYHTAGDTGPRINYDFLTEIAKASIISVAELADQ